jgi:sarcosine oxidase subunit delta
MRITCPHCGPRGNHEFTYCGDASLVRPAPRLGDASESAASPEWMDYVYWRKNRPQGHREYFYHASGCRALLVLTRHPDSHDILDVALASDAARPVQKTGA